MPRLADLEISGLKYLQMLSRVCAVFLTLRKRLMPKRTGATTLIYWTGTLTLKCLKSAQSQVTVGYEGIRGYAG